MRKPKDIKIGCYTLRKCNTLKIVDYQQADYTNLPIYFCAILLLTNKISV